MQGLKSTKHNVYMDVENLIKIAIMSIVQGITELLPISSSTHLILIASIIDFDAAYVIDTLQIGSMIAIACFYRKILINQIQIIISSKRLPHLCNKIMISLIPAAIVGLIDRNALCISQIKPTAVSLLVILGGILFFVIEKLKITVKTDDLEAITCYDSIRIGLIQSIAVMPGFSRLGATIMAGRIIGFDMKTSVQFSFLISLPLLGLTSLYDLIKYELQFAQLMQIAIGIILTCITSILLIKKLHLLLVNHGLIPFGYYRLILGMTLYIISNMT